MTRPIGPESNRGFPRVESKGYAMPQEIPRSTSRMNGYVKAVLAFEAVKRRREERDDRFVRALDRRRDALATEVATRTQRLTGTQQGEARRIIGVINRMVAIKDGAK